MIPKIFHQYWSERSFPEVYREYQASWLTCNRDWDLCFWTPDNLFDLELRQWFDDARYYSDPDWIGQWRSHIVRYEALYQFGGVWIDCDMAALRPLEALVRPVEAFAARDTPIQVQTAILGATAGHRWMADLMEDTRHMAPLPTRTCASVIQVKRVLPRHPEVTIFEPWTFYSMDRFTGLGLSADAYGVHAPRAYR